MMTKTQLFKQLRLAVVMFVAFLLALPALAGAGTQISTFYVNAATGSDLMNICDNPSFPCKTISHAVFNFQNQSTTTPCTIEVAAGTYNAALGEVFPISITKNDLILVGADKTTTFISGPSSGNLLQVSGNGFSVSDFTFADASHGLDFSQSGFTVHNNIFAATVATGIYGSVYPPTASTNVTLNPVSFTNNQFLNPDYGVDFKWGITFDGASTATTGLTGTIGSITATGNTFTNSSNGFFLDEMAITYMESGTAVFGAVNVSNNTFTNCSEGARVDNIYANQVNDSTVTFGNITFNSNTSTTSGTGIKLNGLHVDGMTGSTVTWGNVSIDGNTATDNDYPIDFSGFFGSFGNQLTNTNVTLGNMSVSNNTLTDTVQTAIGLNYFNVEYVYGTSTVMLGNLTVHNNTIESTTPAVPIYGLYLYTVGDITYIYDAASVTTGTLAITDNTVVSDNYALEVYNEGVWNIGTKGATDTVDVNFGPTNISGNHFTSNGDYAVYLGIFYFGYDQHAQTTIDVGLLTVHDNDMISKSKEAIYFYYHYYSGYDLFDDAQLTIDGLVFTNNRITSDTTYGAYIVTEGVGYTVYDNSQITVGPSTITGNTITGSGEALYIYFYYNAYDMYDSSMLTMSPWTVSNNTLTSTSAVGSPDSATFYLYYYDYSVGTYMYNNSKATLPDWIITNNTIDTKGDYDGFQYYNYENSGENYNNAYVDYGSMLIDNNTFNPNMDTGMYNGIYLYVYETGNETYNNATTVWGDVTVTNNKIYNVSNEAIYLDYDGFPYNAYDSTVFIGGDFIVSNNMIAGASYGIDLEFDYFEVNDTGTNTVGTFTVSDNTLTGITSDGIYINTASYNTDPATATQTTGATTIKNNTITAGTGGDDGIYFYADIQYGDVTFGMPVLSNNTISGFTNAVYLESGTSYGGLDEMTMSCNWLQNSSSNGLRFLTEGKNFIVTTNSITNNTGFGLSVDDGYAANINAEKNWWGDMAGPASCASCNGVNPGDLGTVDFTPWLTSEPIKSSCGSKFPWIMFTPVITGMKPATL